MKKFKEDCFIKQHKEKIYIVDFKRVINKVEDKTFLFYYPFELKGFIQSCVLSSQRNDKIKDDNIIESELSEALKVFNSNLELQLRIRGIDNISEVKHNVSDDLDLAKKINNHVFKAMDNIRNKSGDYSVVEDSFIWTDTNALIMRLNFNDSDN